MPPIAEVTLKDINSEKFYALEDSSGGKISRSFAGRRTWRSGKFVWFCSELLTLGNSYNDADTLEGLIQWGIAQRNFKVFEFETSKELFLWMAQSDV